MHVLAIANNKGGVGKTTLTLHLGTALAHQGHQVLLVDADPQATLTRWLMPAEPEEGLSQLISHDYGSGAFTDDLVMDTPTPNLRILPAGLGLEAAYGQLQGLSINRFRDALDDLHSPVDVVLIDSPPRLGSVAEALLVAADSVLYPVDGGSESLVALQKLGKTVARVQKYRPALSVLGVVVTRSQSNATHRLVEKALNDLYATFPVRCAVPESAYVLQATARRATVFDIAARNRQASTCAKAYTTVAENIAGVIGL